MLLCKWEKLPEVMRRPAIRAYYDVLNQKRFSLLIKRVFDFVAALVLLVIASPLLLGIAIAIRCDSSGPVFFRQTRVTRYGREFRIFKFRTMVADADKGSGQLTVSGDSRITRVGRRIRDNRLDELPQLLNILAGDLSFVGTRPEVPRYVAQYSDEMLATLLLPAGVTSEASILYKDEARLLDGAEDAAAVYVQEVLPGKMAYNLESIRRFSLWREVKTLFRTVMAVCGVDMKPMK